MRAVFGLSAIAAALAFACGDSLSGLTSGEGTQDGGPTDASSSDGGAPSDGGTADGSGITGDADAGRFCDTITPAPLFCDDFDGNDPLGLLWGSDLQRASATKTGGSLLVATEAVSTGEEAVAIAVHNVGRPSTVELSFRMFVEQDVRFTRSAAALRVQNTGGFYDIEITLVSSTEVRLDEYAEPGFDGASAFGTQTGFQTDYVRKWRDVRVEVAYEGSQHARVWFAGSQTPVVDRAITPTLVSANLGVFLGATIVRGPESATSIRYDDVVVRTK